MAAKITNPWKNSRMSGAEKTQRQIERLEDSIKHAESVLAWQMSEGYETQAELSRAFVAALRAKLTKLT